MRHSIKYATYFHSSMYNSPHLPDNMVKFDFTENRSAVKLLRIFMTSRNIICKNIIFLSYDQGGKLALFI